MDDQHIKILKEKLGALFKATKEIYSDLNEEDQIEKTREVYNEMGQKAIQNAKESGIETDFRKFAKELHDLFDQYFENRNDDS